MKTRRATFITSAAGASGFPAADHPEFAFAGRSNVGKSSLINALTGVAGLARTSAAPGRTRLLNWFRVETGQGPIAFVDLPGYGYAKVPMEMRDSWRPLVESYLTDRPVLRAVLLLVDARRGAQDEERDLADWLAESGIAVQVVMTKADKLAKNKRWPAVTALRRELGLSRDPLAVSVDDKAGLDAVWRYIIGQRAG
jgi:GTP-binding protein